jgi:hypothetical protein
LSKERHAKKVNNEGVGSCVWVLIRRKHIIYMGARVLSRKGLWLPKAMSGIDNFQGKKKLGQILK